MDRYLAAAGRIQQQENADRHAIVVEHVTEARIALRNLAFGLTAQSLHPVFARSAHESARQEVRDRIQIGLGDLTASKFLSERRHLPSA